MVLVALFVPGIYSGADDAAGTIADSVEIGVLRDGNHSCPSMHEVKRGSGTQDL